MNSLQRWCVFKAQANRSKIAEWHLSNQGFEVFVPKIKVTRRQRAKLVDAIEPMFPNYGFISFDGSPARWRSINGSRGVSYLLSSNGKASFVSNHLIGFLLDNCQNTSNGLVELGQGFKIGDKVELIAGPFSQQIGILQSLDSAGRVKVLLQLLGREVPVSVSTTAIMARD